MSLQTRIIALGVVAFAFMPLASLAEDAPNPCTSGTVTSGSSSVMVEASKQPAPATQRAAPAPSPKAPPT